MRHTTDWNFQAQCIKNLGNVLDEAGSSWDKVVKVNVYLKNMDDFGAMNEVYQEVSNHGWLYLYLSDRVWDRY